MRLLAGYDGGDEGAVAAHALIDTASLGGVVPEARPTNVLDRFGDLLQPVDAYA